MMTALLCNYQRMMQQVRRAVLGSAALPVGAICQLPTHMQWRETALPTAGMALLPSTNHHCRGSTMATLGCWLPTCALPRICCPTCSNLLGPTRSTVAPAAVAAMPTHFSPPLHRQLCCMCCVLKLTKCQRQNLMEQLSKQALCVCCFWPGCQTLSVQHSVG